MASGIGLLMTSAWLIAKAALQPSIAELQVAIVGVRFFGLSRGVFRYLERYISHRVNFKLLARLRVWLYERLEPLAPARLQQHRSGDLLARIVADINTLEHFYVRVLAPPLVAVLTLGLMALLLGQFDGRLPLILTIFLVLAGGGLPLLIGRLGGGTGARLVGTRSELNATLVDAIQGLPDLLAFGVEGRYTRQVAALSLETASLQARMAAINGLSSGLLALLTNLAVVTGLVVAIPLVREAQLEGVQLAAIALGIMASFEAVAPLPQAAQYLEQSLAAARRLFELVEPDKSRQTEPTFRPEIRSAVQPPPDLPATPANLDAQAALPFPPRIVVADLRFRYEPDAAPALDGVSFELPPGGRVAVVGPSGAGKSTLINLLLRFWDYQEGEISVNGWSLRQLEPEAVRELFSVVTQDPYLFSGTVRDNLLLARPDASHQELVEAARQAQIHDFIQSLPNGYDTWIGEQGVQLSGGQRQRLAIARALLKNAPILIFDEPTANLDRLTAARLWRDLLPVLRSRSVLLITHQLIGLEAANEILVLYRGRVVERGQHSQLMRTHGLYWRMWKLQRQQFSPQP